VNRPDPAPLIDPALGADERRSLAAEGAAMSDEEAVGYALAPEVPGVPAAP
jgi:hypothetical protein